MGIKEARFYTVDQVETHLIFMTGKCPLIYNVETKETFSFFNTNTNKTINSYTYILKETVDRNSFLIFIKEIYLILLIKEHSNSSSNRNKYLLDNIIEKKLNDEQFELYEAILNNLNKNYVLVDLYGLDTSGEIVGVQLNFFKNLILVNSNDRILRLYRYDLDLISLLREYFDSVNRKKWVNAYFFTFKAGSFIQDMIVSALSDINSLEFVFIDIRDWKFC